MYIIKQTHGYTYVTYTYQQSRSYRQEATNYGGTTFFTTYNTACARIKKRHLGQHSRTLCSQQLRY